MDKDRVGKFMDAVQTFVNCDNKFSQKRCDECWINSACAYFDLAAINIKEIQHA